MQPRISELRGVASRFGAWQENRPVSAPKGLSGINPVVGVKAFEPTPHCGTQTDELAVSQNSAGNRIYDGGKGFLVGVPDFQTHCLESNKELFWRGKVELR